MYGAFCDDIRCIALYTILGENFERKWVFHFYVFVVRGGKIFFGSVTWYRSRGTLKLQFDSWFGFLPKYRVSYGGLTSIYVFSYVIVIDHNQNLRSYCYYSNLLTDKVYLSKFVKLHQKRWRDILKYSCQIFTVYILVWSQRLKRLVLVVRKRATHIYLICRQSIAIKLC